MADAPLVVPLLDGTTLAMTVDEAKAALATKGLHVVTATERDRLAAATALLRRARIVVDGKEYDAAEQIQIGRDLDAFLAKQPAPSCQETGIHRDCDCEDPAVVGYTPPAPNLYTQALSDARSVVVPVAPTVCGNPRFCTCENLDDRIECTARRAAQPVAPDEKDAYDNAPSLLGSGTGHEPAAPTRIEAESPRICETCGGEWLDIHKWETERAVLDAFGRVDRAIIELWTRDASARSPVRQLAEAELARRGLKP